MVDNPVDRHVGGVDVDGTRNKRKRRSRARLVGQVARLNGFCDCRLTGLAAGMRRIMRAAAGRWC